MYQFVCGMCGKTKTVEQRYDIRKFCSKACYGQYLNTRREKQIQPVEYERIKDINEAGYTALVCAIVAQAKDDVLKYSPKSAVRQDAEDFFLNGYFDELTEMDGYDILCKLSEEYDRRQEAKKKKRGTW